MKMKKYFSIFLCLVMFFLITACKKEVREPRQYFIVSDFEGQAVGILEDSGLEASVKDRIPGATVKKYSSIDQAVDELKSHKIETIIVNAAVADSLIKNDDSLAKVLQVYTDNKTVIGSVTIGEEAEGYIVADIDATISRIKGNGKYDELLDKYIQKKAPTGNESNIEFNKSEIGRELVIGVCSNYYPFSYKNDSGEWAGFDIEIANEIAKYYHATPIFKEYNKDQIMDALKSGKIRVGFGHFNAKESESWPHPVYPSMYLDESVYLISNKVDVGANPFTGEYLK